MLVSWPGWIRNCASVSAGVYARAVVDLKSLVGRWRQNAELVAVPTRIQSAAFGVGTWIWVDHLDIGSEPSELEHPSAASAKLITQSENLKRNIMT